MATTITATESKRHPSSMIVGTLVGSGLVLLIAAWFTAQKPLISTGIETPIWKIVLAGMALPWTLQWCAWACLLFAVAKLCSAVPAVASGSVLTLILGMLWWAGLFATMGKGNVLDGLMQLMSIDIEMQFGSEAAWKTAWLGFIGPAVNPLQLRGPSGMVGWDFLFVTLSTLLTTLYWTWIARWVNPDRANPPSTARQLGKLALAWLPFFLLAIGTILWRVLPRFFELQS